METLSRYQEGTVLQAPNGKIAVVSRGALIPVTKDVLKADSVPVSKHVNVDQAEFDSWRTVSALATLDPALDDYIWDTGLQGVKSGEQGHLCSFKGRLTRATGQILGECRALDTTWLSGFHVSFTALVHDADGFPLRSGIPPFYLRVGVDGRWVGVSDRTVPWAWQITAADAARVANIIPTWTWDPDSFQKIMDQWVTTATKIGDIVTKLAPIAKLFTTAATPTSPVHTTP